jgi:AcrR family transcriptional regulator
MATSQSTYHQPRRKPAHETLEKILTAAEDQLREQELDLFTIQSVLHRTGLSVGAFYSRFPDKTALLRALQERVHSRIDPQILAELAGLTGATRSLDEAVDSGFGILMRHVLSERKLFRAFMMMSVFDPLMRQRGEQFNWERKRAIAALLAPHHGEIGDPYPDLAIDTAYAIYSSTMRGRLVYYESAADAQFLKLRRSLASFLRYSNEVNPAPSVPAKKKETGR